MVRYVDLDKIVAEIERICAEEKAIFDEQCRGGYEPSPSPAVVCMKMEHLLSFVNTLEVIEIGVDLGDSKGDKSTQYIIDTKTLEVKEVDLDKEIDFVEDKYHGFYSLSRADIIDVARHFFEFGLKAQKGE